MVRQGLYCIARKPQLGQYRVGVLAPLGGGAHGGIRFGLATQKLRHAALHPGQTHKVESKQGQVRTLSPTGPESPGQSNRHINREER